MTEPREQKPAESDTESVRQAFAAAARKAGIGQVAPGEVPTAGSLLKAVGGVRGLIEAILPGMGFLVIYTFTGNLVASVLAPVAVSAVFVIVRLVQKTPATQAFAGLAGVGISAVLALLTWRAEDSFVPGLIINVVSVLVLLVSIAVRWPLIGVIVGLLANDSHWRQDANKRRVLYIATWLWVGLFSARLLVQAPLYFSSNTEWLAATKLLMGVPLYAGMLWVTWMLVRWAYSPPASSTADDTA
ncbi:DUF3159 domain-containing protein [Cryobacterium sp. BB307]|uniref:DUF3159 domain-containing protein n=1 Tax=Cryobacterium sp. BB307 TaxID=2716317 RepID=UPI001447CF9C|nr:DUF3159 domain-containing protein [Cryobacterium sp. BB307]